MSYYLLPRNHNLIYKSLECVENKTTIKPVVSFSLADYLYDIKKKISEKGIDWDTYKKYTNPYEYIHSIVPGKKKSVSKYKPLSRSYFKMLEILRTFEFNFATNINTFHLAEGPGGFIEAMVSYRKSTQDKYIGITLLDDKEDPTIPSWKKSESFLKNNPNVFIEKGRDKTGDILSLNNFLYCKEKYSSSMDFITGDGGFDFSVDFNKQEISISKLLFAQVIYAIVLQKKNGSFVLKLFDCFMQHTIDILYLLSSFYSKVYIMKPNSSRFANSEKYIICKGFLFESCELFFPYLLNVFTKMITIESENIQRFLNVPISNYYLTKVEEYNAIFGQQQIENIYYTISLIDSKISSEKIDQMIKLNTQKCVQWCLRHNVVHNSNLHIVENVFLSQNNLI
jgi:23S rRNA U2552 (ribose-2'-O)-methylase RlmE/FtsJ|tara:strand:- start:124 stop:1311 length:1188 start_codon:yes stop_codon:yes gene_type:complete